MSKLQGKIAVITGGSSGIGLATAQRFVEEGAYVFIVGRRQVELNKAVNLIGKNVTAIQADVTKLEDIDRLFTEVAKVKKVVHILVTSAGLVEHAPLALASPEHFDKTFNLNARAVFFTTQKVLPLMTAGGSIVLISSGMHSKGFPAFGAYSATKAALRSFARTWAAELKDQGIRVNTLSPGAIETPMLNGQFASKEEADAGKAMFSSITPLGRIGRPEEMAAAALFLASEESSYSTAMDLVADGGATGV